MMNSNKTKTPKFRVLESRYYQSKVPLVSLDYYDQHSHGEDDFSRKQVWFYSYGDEEIEKEFREGLNPIFQQLFLEDNLEWDMITQYPTHTENQLNPNLRDLFLEISAETDIPMGQVLERTETVQENHMISNEKAKVVNLEGSLSVNRDVEGKNIILVDNIVLSGISILQGVDVLKQAGAENVFAVTLGTSIEHKDGTRELNEGQKASELLELKDGG